MNLLRFLLTTLLLLGSVVNAAAQKAPATSRKAAPAKPRAKELFIGSSNASGALKIAILPTASDLETQAQKLSSRLRNVDPFGLSTFPREDEAVPAPDAPERPTERITLNQALQTLRITGINLSTKEVLIGGRSIFEGDVMMLSFKNEVFLAQVQQIGTTQILFRDLKRQESGALPHTLLPHLELEPMQSRSRKDSLEGKVTAIEPLNSQPR